MDIIDALTRRAERLRDELEQGTIFAPLMADRRDDILELQRIQLLEGKDNAGNDLRPYYTEDLKPSGYFRSAETAKKYAAWKLDLSYPYEVQRNPDAPNLYINGKFHSELDVHFMPTGLAIVAGSAYASGIMAKYGADRFGLSDEKWGVLLRERGVMTELFNEIRNILYE